MSQDPVSLNVDASTHCQLRCATCPTAAGDVKKRIGAGHLSASEFEDFVRSHPRVIHVELANWGEILLNPELPEILKIGHTYGVALTAFNGVNLNHASEDALDGIVRYGLACMTVAIDGASQPSYEAYRIRGDLSQVLANVRKLNELKRRYRSYFPVLMWQFVAFGHNEHEVEKARALARELGMHFYVKLAWDDFSPVRDPSLIRSVTLSGSASREDYLDQHGEHYLQKALCRQLWNNVQINFDGEVLGCCANRWSSFGNAFEQGLEAVLDGELMRHTKDVLLGRAEPREDTPCVECDFFDSMRERRDFMSLSDTEDRFRKLLYRIPRPVLNRRIIKLAHRSRTFKNWVVRPLMEASIKRALY